MGGGGGGGVDKHRVFECVERRQSSFPKAWFLCMKRVQGDQRDYTKGNASEA